MSIASLAPNSSKVWCTDCPYRNTSTIVKPTNEPSSIQAVCAMLHTLDWALALTLSGQSPRSAAHLQLHNLVRELGQGSAHRGQQRAAPRPSGAVLLLLPLPVLEHVHHEELVQRAQHFHALSIPPLLQRSWQILSSLASYCLATRNIQHIDDEGEGRLATVIQAAGGCSPISFRHLQP